VAGAALVSAADGLCKVDGGGRVVEAIGLAACDPVLLIVNLWAALALRRDTGQTGGEFIVELRVAFTGTENGRRGVDEVMLQ